MPLTIFPGVPAFRRATTGLSLTEIAIVLAVIGLLLGGIWVIGGQVYTSNQVRTAADEVVTIAQNTRAVFVEQGGVTGNNASTINQALDQMKVFPLEMRQGPTPTGIISNLWQRGASVQVAADDCTGTENAATPQPCFGITFLSVPQNPCTRLLTVTGQAGMGLQRVMVNGAVVGDATAGTMPITPSAAGICAATNTILWVYLLRGGK